jgi:cytidylate kinase
LILPSIITIDGPAGSGKSTLGKKLAEYLGYLFFDTGVMYRALTWLALKQGVPMEDERAVTDLAIKTTIDVRPPAKCDGRAYDVWVGDQDVTWDIREPNVEANVSVVSAYSGVRKSLSTQQRRIGMRGKVVMVGRDIGTVVLPEAELKIFLDASVEERARRRYVEFQARGENISLETIQNAMIIRDRIDSTRAVAPLRRAEEAVIINSDGMDAQQVVEIVKELIKKFSVRREVDEGSL